MTSLPDDLRQSIIQIIHSFLTDNLEEGKALLQRTLSEIGHDLEGFDWSIDNPQKLSEQLIDRLRQSDVEDGQNSAVRLLLTKLCEHTLLIDVHECKKIFERLNEHLEQKSIAVPDASVANIQSEVSRRIEHPTPVDQRGQTVLGNQYNIVNTEDSQYDVSGFDSPYPWLSTFTYKDRYIFGGRDELINQHCKIISERQQERTLFFVTGVSGSGKSSFAQAGLLPGLEQIYRARNRSTRLAVLRPTQAQLSSLATHNWDVTLDIVDYIPTTETKTAQATFQQGDDVPVLLLVIDQFEEFFDDRYSTQRSEIFEKLISLPKFAERPIHIIVTLRADYLPDLINANKELFEIAMQGIALGKMSKAQLEDSITRPLNEHNKRVGSEKKFERELLTKLAEEAAEDAGHLPLLQVALDDLWRGGLLRLTRFNGLQEAIEKRANDVFEKCKDASGQLTDRPKSDQAMLLSILLDLVNVSLDDNVKRDIRQRRRLDELESNDVERERLIQELIQERLLVSDDEKEQSKQASYKVVDLIHESLLVKWPKLKEKIASQRERLKQRARFKLYLDDWITNKRQEDYLLTGVRLAEAQDLAKLEDISIRDKNAQLFLKQSITKHEAKIRRRNQITFVVITSLSVLLLWALNRQYVANIARNSAELSANEAVRQKDLAKKNETVAKENEIRANIQTGMSLSRTVILHANTSQQQLTIDPIASGYLSFQAVPHPENEVPYVAVGEFALVRSAKNIQESSYLTVPTPPFGGNQFAISGTTLAIDGDNLYVFELSDPLKTKTVIQTSVDPTAAKRGVDWGPNGRLLQFNSNQGLRIFDTTQCNPTCKEFPQPKIEGAIGCAKWSPKDERVGVCTDVALQVVSTHGITSKIDSVAAIDVAWSRPDGKWLAAWGDDWETDTQTLVLWDATGAINATQVVTLENGNSIFADLLWLDEEHLITVHEKKIAIRSVKNWDRPQYTDTSAFLGTADVDNATLSPDKQFLLIFLDNGDCQFWKIEIDSQSGTTLQYAGKLAGHTKSILSAAWHSNYLATTSMDGTIRIWRLSIVEDRVEADLVSILYGYPGTTFDDRADIFGAKWLNNQKNVEDSSAELLTYGEDGSLRIWRMFDSQGYPICSGTDTDGTTQCIDEYSKYESALGETLQGSVSYIRTYGDGRFVATSSNGTAGIGSFKDASTFIVLPPPAILQSQVISTFQVYGMIWDDHGKRLLTYLEHGESLEDMVENPFLDGIVRNIGADGSIMSTVTIPGPITSALWVGDQLLVNEVPSITRLVDASDPNKFNPIPELDSEVIAVQRSSKDSIAVLEQNGDLSIWNANFSAMLFFTTTQMLNSKPSPGCNLLDWSEDGTKLLSGGGQVSSWNPSTGNEPVASVNKTSTLQNKRLDEGVSSNNQAFCISFGPDETQVAFTNQNYFYIVDADSGNLHWKNDRHDEQINGLEWLTGTVWSNQFQWPLNYLPGNQQDERHLLLTWSVDGTVRLWDVQQQSEIMRLGYQESPSPSATLNPITAASVSKDGRFILTATSTFLDGGEIGILRSWRSWHRQPECLLQEAWRRIEHRKLTDKQLEQFGLSADINDKPLFSTGCS